MGNDLISREALKKHKVYSEERREYVVPVYNIDNASTVPLPDFKEGYKQAIIDGKTNFSRPRGEWIGDTDYESYQGHYEAYKCNKCNYGLHWSAYYTKDYNFCPNCGADMRGGAENERWYEK